jgi:hypothetical protein
VPVVSRLSDRTAATQIVQALVEAGHSPYEVRSGHEGELVSTVQQAVDEILAVSICRLYVRLADGTGDGWVLFVLGNDHPLDMVADWTTSLSSVIEPVMDTW